MQQPIINAVTREETAPSADPSFPYRAAICDLGEYEGQLCPWHWHNEVELFYVQSGSQDYCLAGGTTSFHPGDVGFLNANVLHMTKSTDFIPCKQQEHIFLPQLVAGAAGSAIERKYVLPLLQNAAADLLFFPANSAEAEEMRRWMDCAFQAALRREAGYELVIRDMMSRLWFKLLAHMPSHEERHGADSERIKAMLRYIEVHYSQSITLEQLAAAASISPRESSRCFRRLLNMTPFEYLLNYRIDRACELLRHTDMPITEAGLRCGFASPSYFGKLFRQRLGRSPGEYRRNGG